MLWRLDYDWAANDVLVIEAMGINDRAQGQYLDVEEDLDIGRGGGISKRHSQLGAEM